MLISLIMQIAQSMQISIRHCLTPQTMYITFPLKNLAVKNIFGLVCLASGLYLFTHSCAGQSEVTPQFLLLPAHEHRAASVPRHRRQSPAARGGATDATDDGRTTLGKHSSLQENFHQ